jgi:hypothetical protein
LGASGASWYISARIVSPSMLLCDSTACRSDDNVAGSGIAV